MLSLLFLVSNYLIIDLSLILWKRSEHSHRNDEEGVDQHAPDDGQYKDDATYIHENCDITKSN